MKKFILSLIAMVLTLASWAGQETDCTSSIVNADLSDTSGWTTDGTKGISGGAVKVGSRSNFDFSQTINLAAGQYKLIAQAAYRYDGSEQAEYDAITAGKNTKLVELYAGDAKVAIKNRWEGATDAALEGTSAVAVNGKFVPNSSNDVVAYMKAGKYDNELVFTVKKAGDIKIGIRRVAMPENDITDYTNISAWKLVRTGDAPAELDLTNINFESATAVTGKICTYAKDVKDGECSGIQDLDGWVSGENGDARAAGVFTYGSTVALGGDGYVAPATAPEGSTNTKVLGLNAVWGATVKYTKEVTLAAGNYKFEALVYNSGAGKNNLVKNFIGFVADNGTEYLASTASYNSNEWTTESFNISLTEETKGNISLGFSVPNTGTAANHHLFVDHISITAISNESALADAKAAALESINALSPIGDALFVYSQSAIDAAKSSIEAATTVEEVNAVAMPAVNQPKADAKYIIKNVSTGLYLAAGSNGISIESDPTTFAIEAAEGGFYIKNGEYYVGIAGTNGWSMSSAADNKAVITFGAQAVEGGYVYTLKESLGMVGTDGTEAGATCYADKNAEKNGLWTIEEYVEPAGVAFSFTYKTDGQTPVAIAFGSAKGGVKYGVDFGNGTIVETEEIAQTTALSTVSQITGVPVGTDGEATISVYADPTDIASLSISASIANDDAEAATKRDANRVAYFNGSKLTALNQLSLNYGAFEGFDLSPYTSLTQVNMMNGKLNAIDLTICPSLTSVNLTANALETVKVAGMEKMSYLNLNDNPALKKLDVSNMPALANLYAQQTATGVKGELTEVDMSGNTTTLTFLYLNNNKIQKLNIPCTVATFEAMNNEIEEFSVANATKTCKIEGNKLTFATLPVKPAGISSTSKLKKFTYAPQADLAVENMTTDDVLDLSAQLTAVGENTVDNDPAKEAGEATTTTYSFKAGETELVEGTDYTVVEAGKFKFAAAYDSVVCTMVNTAFPKFQTVANAAFKTVAFNVTVKSVPQPNEKGYFEVATDGETEQYLLNIEAKAFLIGANEWGTRASASIDKTYKVKIKANGDGTYTLNDYVGSSWNALDCQAADQIWVDGSGRGGWNQWVIAPVEGEDRVYEITNKNVAGKLGVKTDMSDTRLYMTSEEGYSTRWAFMSEETFNAYLVARAEEIAAEKKAQTDAANTASLAAMKAIMDGTNIYDQNGYETYLDNYTGYKTQMEEGTLTEVVVNPSSTTGWHASTAFNFLLTPWTIGGEAANNFDKALYINTWSTEGVSDGSNFLVPFFEYWTGDENSLGQNTLSTTVEGLKAGVYDVKILARVRVKNGATEAPYGITMTAGNGEAVNISAGTQVGTSQMYLAEYTAQGAADADGKLVININIDADNNISWLSYKNVYYSFNSEATTGISTISTEVAKDGKFVENGNIVIVKNGKKFNVAGQAVK